MLRLARASLTLATFAVFTVSSWSFWQSPLVSPYRDRTEAELKVAFDAALTRDLTMRQVQTRIDAALAEGETDQAMAILQLADHRGVTVQPNQRDRVIQAEEDASGWSACAACAIDHLDCPDLTRVATCNLPLELTPVGDAKAIYRGLEAYVLGQEVDRIDLALGVVGLAATAAILASGGSSTTIKAGATALRVARRTGAMTANLSDEIAILDGRTLRLDQAPEVLRGSAEISALVDPAAAARLAEVASNVGRLTDAMPMGQALAVMRYADNTDDLARIARVAHSAGDETRAAVAVMGKARVLRLTTRITDIALLMGALALAALGQCLAFLMWLARRGLRPAGQGRAARPTSPRRKPIGRKPR